MRRAVPVVAVCVAMWTMLVAPQASAFSISFSNGDSHAWVSVYHHDGFAEPEQQVVESGSDPQAIDIGYASASSSAGPFLLSADAAIDGSQTGSLVFVESVSATARSSYVADVVFGGGVGTFLLRLSGDLSESDGPGNLQGTAVWALSGGLLLSHDPDGSKLYELDYGVAYGYMASVSSTAIAEVGEDAWRSRDLGISFVLVPEPGAGVLLAFGLALLSGRSRRDRC